MVQTLTFTWFVFDALYLEYPCHMTVRKKYSAYPSNLCGLLPNKWPIGDEHAMPGSVQELTDTLWTAIDEKGNVST